VPDSYEHLLLDFIDGDNHLFTRSDEHAAAWNILTTTLQEIDEKRTTPELYEEVEVQLDHIIFMQNIRFGWLVDN
jgi:glucose-6-phosphate 1-dehydrogenase